ncbi:pilus assembly protein TadG-related protein [Streptomyces sp. CNQ085]|uniref:pilus assembly protein TadG-related protein n=1 Tax=Streptomyces sp. CNQ085 TaxID=2886944 RepID=UPI001F5054EB|nr:pilus assembly protein TadG-related protein [Streptomyces sp. CNQ085]MCI0383862.1 pilus assembly protein TadG-related protein [Streptomyces sp. CNQ085]
MTRRGAEAGQAAPVYVTAVAGLLFLAFAYFAVGMASAGRNDAQGAADAAALAAAQDARDGIREDLLDLFDPDAWEDLLDGDRPGGTSGPCGEASEFARKNRAETVSCEPVSFPAGFTVEVRNARPIGESLIPGTENRYAEAAATAVIEPRCGVREAEREPEDPPGEPGDGEDEEREGSEEAEKEHELFCEGIDDPIEIDPDRLADLLPDPEDLFSVRLADR